MKLFVHACFVGAFGLLAATAAAQSAPASKDPREAASSDRGTTPDAVNAREVPPRLRRRAVGTRESGDRAGRVIRGDRSAEWNRADDGGNRGGPNRDDWDGRDRRDRDSDRGRRNGPRFDPDWWYENQRYDRRDPDGRDGDNRGGRDGRDGDGRWDDDKWLDPDWWYENPRVGRNGRDGRDDRDGRWGWNERWRDRWDERDRRYDRDWWDNDRNDNRWYGPRWGRPVLGVRFVDAAGGVRVFSVIDNGPADEAGLRRGDVIYSLNGRRIYSGEQALDALASRDVGELVRITYGRRGRLRTAYARLEAWREVF